MKLTKPTTPTHIDRAWHHYDVKDKVLGRMATDIALQLIGKKKPYYVPYLDCGDYVVVTNAANAVLTGKKEEQKIYHAYSGYPGGLKRKTVTQVRTEHPERILMEAVSGMLPKNKLRASMLRRLYIYPGDAHPHGAKLTKKQ